MEKKKKLLLFITMTIFEMNIVIEASYLYFYIDFLNWPVWTI